MKIFTRKDKDEVLKRIATCQMITIEFVDDPKAYSKITDSLTEIAVLVGGIEGLNKIQRSIHKRYDLTIRK